MHIKSIKVSGLFGRPDEIVLDLNRDLNLITGKNGSGKTTIMKLAWAIISGNIIHALEEVEFTSCEICTSDYTCLVTRTAKMHCNVLITTDKETIFLEDDQDDDDPFPDQAEDAADPILRSMGGSIFFPTFRRIEGGFSMSSRVGQRVRSARQSESEINVALSTLSKKLSHADHVFVSAISTQDIVSLLIRRYGDFSELVNSFQAKISKEVIEKIKHYEASNSKNEQDPSELLSETRSDIESIEEYRLQVMRPLTAVRVLAERLFQHSGISFGSRLNFGDAAEAINSDSLSAGEKQMLSFICYNAFQKDSVVFIDEPELSLHVDWQRQLYGILESQQSGNQFIFATHSPFIYGKYPDKEILVDPDRGE